MGLVGILGRYYIICIIGDELKRVDFATFCYSGDAQRLHAPGQLLKQIESNNYPFSKIIVVHQRCNPFDYENPSFEDVPYPLDLFVIDNPDRVLNDFGIPLDGQYRSDTDHKHWWKYHVVNHLVAVSYSNSDYIVFSDADCWIKEQPDNESWVDFAIKKLQLHPEIFIVSPNDGEPERMTQRMSQQMFMTRTEEFRNADFTQPGWDGNTNIPGGPMPEYHAMLEGRIHHYCVNVGKFRYVCPPKYRYWHHQW